MSKKNQISIGQVVKSKAGRDKGRLFIILDILDDNYVYLVDGDLRKLDKPKKKKVKHLITYNTILLEFKHKVENNIKLNNEYIRKLLEPIK